MSPITWRELMFADPDQAAKATRDPVAPAQRSPAALAKAARHTLEDGTPVHSFATLLGELATLGRDTPVVLQAQTPIRRHSTSSRQPTRTNGARSI